MRTLCVATITDLSFFIEKLGKIKIARREGVEGRVRLCLTRKITRFDIVVERYKVQKERTLF